MAIQIWPIVLLRNCAEESSWTALAAKLPGCGTQAESRDEALRRMAELAPAMVASYRADGREPPFLADPVSITPDPEIEVEFVDLQIEFDPKDLLGPNDHTGCCRDVEQLKQAVCNSIPTNVLIDIARHARIIGIQRAVAALNAMLAESPDALTALCEYRVPCASQLGSGTSCQTVYDDGQEKVGLLGILNGIFGAVVPEGRGYIAAEYDDSNKVTGFIVLPINLTKPPENDE